MISLAHLNNRIVSLPARLPATRPGFREKIPTATAPEGEWGIQLLHLQAWRG